MTVRPPDPAKSRAVLIGTYAGGSSMGLHDLPSVKRNLKGMRRLLMGDSGWALPEEHCRYLPQPADERTVLREVQKAAAEATDTLLVYYAGHGLLVGPDENLYLAVPEAEAGDECLAYDKLQARIAPGVRRASKAVVILDCCYGGRALLHEMSESGAQPDFEQRLANKAATQGVCVLTSAAATRKSLAPVGKRYTTFTGELIEILEGGLESGGECLDMTTVYEELAGRMKQHHGAPEPQFGTRGSGGAIVLARNNAYGGTRSELALRKTRPVTGVETDQAPILVPSRKKPAERELDAKTLATIGDLAGRSRFKLPGLRGTRQKDVSLVYEEQIPTEGEKLIAFYRWRRTLAPSRCIALTTWGVRLRSRDERFSIPYKKIADYEFEFCYKPGFMSFNPFEEYSWIDVQEDDESVFRLPLTYGDGSFVDDLQLVKLFDSLKELVSARREPSKKSRSNKRRDT